MIVTSRGIVMRQSTDAIARQSRTERGVRLQKLDASDADRRCNSSTSCFS